MKAMAGLSCAWPKTHIVIVGIEKVIPSINRSWSCSGRCWQHMVPARELRL